MESFIDKSHIIYSNLVAGIGLSQDLYERHISPYKRFIYSSPAFTPIHPHEIDQRDKSIKIGKEIFNKILDHQFNSPKQIELQSLISFLLNICNIENPL